MSRKSSVPSPKPSARPAKASTPAEDTLRRLAEMIGRGFDAARMEREVAAMLSTWSQTLDMDDVQERLDLIRSQLAEGIEAAEEQADDVEDGKAAALAAQRTVQAMRATHSALSRAAAVF